MNHAVVEIGVMPIPPPTPTGAIGFHAGHIRYRYLITVLGGGGQQTLRLTSFTQARAVSGVSLSASAATTLYLSHSLYVKKLR